MTKSKMLSIILCVMLLLGMMSCAALELAKSDPAGFSLTAANRTWTGLAKHVVRATTYDLTSTEIGKVQKLLDGELVTDVNDKTMKAAQTLQTFETDEKRFDELYAVAVSLKNSENVDETLLALAITELEEYLLLKVREHNYQEGGR